MGQAVLATEDVGVVLCVNTSSWPHVPVLKRTTRLAEMAKPDSQLNLGRNSCALVVGVVDDLTLGQIVLELFGPRMPVS
jgi:hypothetical protein